MQMILQVDLDKTDNILNIAINLNQLFFEKTEELKCLTWLYSRKVRYFTYYTQLCITHA